MSKAQTLTISVNKADNNGQFSSVTSRYASFSANTWADVSAGSGTNVTVVTSDTEAGDLDPAATQAVHIVNTSFTSFANAFYITRGLCIFDVSNINPDTEWAPKTVEIDFGDIQKPGASNLAVDHSIILAKPNAALFNAIQAAGIGYSTVQSDFLRIEGWTAQQDNSSAITPYSAEFALGAFITGGSGTIRSGWTISLNSTAINDILNNDFFCCWVLDYDYDVRYRDPKTESPSPGAGSAISSANFLIDGSSRGTAVEGAKINYLQGGIKPTSVTKERIENDFTINSFADITDQRGRLNVNGVIADQIPYLLGVKGPLSLRGREFADDGKPISTTVDPPRTKKDSKS